jgi:hypothetical protein
MKTRWACTAFCLATTAGGALSQPLPTKQPDWRIIVGPDLRVSNEPDRPFFELLSSANPRDPKNLVGVATTVAVTGSGMGTSLRAFASQDGGFTWTTSEPDIYRQYGGGDPSVGFSKKGTAFLGGFTTDRERSFNLYVIRSLDGGITWEKPVQIRRCLGGKAGCSISSFAGDYSDGKFGGRMYFGTPSRPGTGPEVYRSDDEGVTWLGPTRVINNDTTLKTNPTRLHVLSDGTLLAWMSRFDPTRNRPKPGAYKNSPMWMAISTDGGETFQDARQLSIEKVSEWKLDVLTFPSAELGVDNSTTAYRDRLYHVWSDWRLNAARVFVSMSSDRGATWSTPQPVDPAAPRDAHQYNPVIAVSRRGVVGVSWFDTRGSTRTLGAEGAVGPTYHEYFAASVDGGTTFLPSVQVSTERSDPDGAGNATLSHAFVQRTSNGALEIDAGSVVGRWGNGGDYMGLTVDTLGVFHPWWTDARTGTFQIYTARISVEHGGAVKPRTTQQIVTASVALVFESSRYDGATRTYHLPVRIRNIGAQSLYGPVQVEITKFALKDTAVTSATGYLITNAANSVRGAGAVFDYTKVLGQSGRLDPGEHSGAVVWKIRAPNARVLPKFTTQVSAGIAGGSK